MHMAVSLNTPIEHNSERVHSSGLLSEAILSLLTETLQIHIDCYHLQWLSEKMEGKL